MSRERRGPPADATDRPLKILHVIPTLGIGGTERQLVDLLPRMDARRYHQTVCHYTPCDSLEERLHAAGIRTVFVPKTAMPAWRFLSRLRAVVRETRPDVVHTWLYSGNFWGRVAAVTCGVRRLVASDRGMALPAGWPVVLYERLLAPFTLRLVNSHAAAGSVVRHYGLPSDRIRVIRNAVGPLPPVPPDARERIRAVLGLPVTERLVLLVGRQSVEKNHAMFFRVARRVAAARPGVTFVAVGRLFERDAMLRRLEESGGAAHVRIVDQQPDVASWLAAADLFCMTSDREGLPNALLEAMAMGLPVVCTAFESVREVVAREDVGVIVPRDDDAAMAAAVLGLLDDPARCRALGGAARAHVVSNFGWERLIRDMEALYGEIDPRAARGRAPTEAPGTT
ncbi:MAG TPA: glycosyltransferase [Candidatus Polarisedimenticolia bacterium]|nr:glycosyltransferase [Candidatus Polarisedimenticolia bacterium]